jgi:hypothetical protein
VLGLNMVLILVLVGAVGWQILELLEARSSRRGARLHVRFVWTFAGAAVVPALVVFGFYGLLVSQGVEKWFSERVQTGRRELAHGLCVLRRRADPLYRRPRHPDGLRPQSRGGRPAGRSPPG